MTQAMRWWGTLGFGVALFTAVPGWAEGGTFSEDGANAAATTPELQQVPEDTSSKWSWEFTFGFAAAVRAEARAGYVLTGGGDALPPGTGGLVSSLKQAPYDRVWVNGPAWELRTTLKHVRMTVGLHKPFAVLGPGDVLVGEVIDGQERQVGARALSLLELRLGLGGEYTFGKVTPFLDMVGDVQWAWLDLTVDGVPAAFRAVSFGYALRGGARVALDEHFFVSASAEVGVIGPVRFGGQLVVGFNFGS
ncbi:MAG: hypothetical protein K1X89_07210 [Myxococcaceae bacterium]|nr:hypothetical protein [Myxococcaceae bacterium]